jgi:MATE family multidrug resistance protein
MKTAGDNPVVTILVKMNRRILLLALPSIASNITVPLLGLCDVVVMGHVGGASHIGAIAVGSMIFNVMYWLFGFLRMGTSGLTAQAVGRMEEVGGEGEGVGGYPSPPTSHPSPPKILTSSLLMALLLGLAIVALQVPLQKLTFWLMQASGDVKALCTPYYYTCVWGAPAMLGLYSLTGWFIGMQDTRTPMVVAIGQNVVNIGLSLLLVIVFRMGIVGVAVGTLVSQWAAFIAAFWAAKRKVTPTWGFGRTKLVVWTDQTHSLDGLKIFNLSGLFRLWARHLRIYLGIFLRTLCLVAVNLYFTSAGSAQGPLVLASNTLLMQFFMFFSYVMDGFAFAGEALAGKSYGAGDQTGLRRVVRCLFAWGAVVAIVFTVVYWLLGVGILSLLTTDASVVSAATVYLPWAVLIPAAGMAAFVWDGVFIGITAVRDMLWTCFVASVAFFAVYLLLSPSLHNHALWLAMLLYLALRGILQTCVFAGGIYDAR